MDGWNTTFLLGWPIFRCYVCFREGSSLEGKLFFVVVSLHLFPLHSRPAAECLSFALLLHSIYGSSLPAPKRETNSTKTSQKKTKNALNPEKGGVLLGWCHIKTLLIWLDEWCTKKVTLPLKTLSLSPYICTYSAVDLNDIWKQFVGTLSIL